MRSLYLFFVGTALVLATGCSKDFLKKYDRRIVGTWEITDVNRIGIGGNTDRLVFREGTFTFNDDGSLTYISPSNVVYQGSWDIKKKTLGDETVRSLLVTAVDYNTQEVLTEYYDDMIFSGTDHFKAQTVSNFHSYMTHFRR
jgi:hypothetical protein